MPASLAEFAQQWIAEARARLRAGQFAETDLDALEERLGRPLRQRLLYLHAREPVVTAAVIAMAEHDPASSAPPPGPVREDWPYDTVLDAMRDGWQVVHFPQQMAPFDDRETDIAGFEFILQKWEPSHE